MKSLILKFVKPLVLAHVKDLSMLAPMLSKVLTQKANIAQDKADVLSLSLVEVVEDELVVLINKL